MPVVIAMLAECKHEQILRQSNRYGLASDAHMTLATYPKYRAPSELRAKLHPFLIRTPKRWVSALIATKRVGVTSSPIAGRSEFKKFGLSRRCQALALHSQPADAPKVSVRPWSIFNAHGWSVFDARQHIEALASDNQAPR